jgi:hypothetical protein
LVASSQAGQSSSDAFLNCFPAIRTDKILATSTPFGYAAALRADVTVGPGRPFLYNAVSMGLVGYAPGYKPSFRGPWVNHGKGVKNRYLGFKFAIKGKIHYGWAAQCRCQKLGWRQSHRHADRLRLRDHPREVDHRRRDQRPGRCRRNSCEFAHPSTGYARRISIRRVGAVDLAARVGGG